VAALPRSGEQRFCAGRSAADRPSGSPPGRVEPWRRRGGRTGRMCPRRCRRQGWPHRYGYFRADCFSLETGHGCFTGSALVLATGGLSIPKMDATGFAYDVARRFGLGVTEQLPALVPLKAMPETLGFDQLLTGVSLEAMVSCAGHNFRENILFTHRGLSGPAILQISSYWRQGGYDLARLSAGVRSGKLSTGA
jgi:predicted flavoprotein YhiN